MLSKVDAKQIIIFVAAILMVMFVAASHSVAGQHLGDQISAEGSAISAESASPSCTNSTSNECCGEPVQCVESAVPSASPLALRSPRGEIAFTTRQGATTNRYPLPASAPHLTLTLTDLSISRT